MPTISLRPATHDDRATVERIYFETQRWIIEELFGWRGEAIERGKFADFYDEANTKIIVVGGESAGWVTVKQASDISVDSLYLGSAFQRKGIGSILLRLIIEQAQESKLTLRINTAKVNPARALYERLGFVLVSEDAFKVYFELK